MPSCSTKRLHLCFDHLALIRAFVPQFCASFNFNLLKSLLWILLTNFWNFISLLLFCHRFGFLKLMNFLVSIILFCAIAGSCLPSGFAVDVCNHEFEVFRFGIQRKCSSSLYPSPLPIEVDGELLDRLMDANQENVYTSILFYDARCPFSRVVRLKFDVLTSIFPHIKHLIAEQSQALPFVFSRYDILACLQF